MATRMLPDAKFLTNDLITYRGKKRDLLPIIDQALRKVSRLTGKSKLNLCDIFSGSGCVARLFKRYANELVVNDLEAYSETVNNAYLMNRSNVSEKELQESIDELNELRNRDALFSNAFDNSEISGALPSIGIIEKLFAPRDENNLTAQDRYLFTKNNARSLDRYSILLQDPCLPRAHKVVLSGLLLYLASVHNLSAGVPTSCYNLPVGIKNKSLSSLVMKKYGPPSSGISGRFLKKISLRQPVLSEYECAYSVYRSDVFDFMTRIRMIGDGPISRELFDLVYIDPPYCGQDYATMYSVLNMLSDYSYGAVESDTLDYVRNAKMPIKPSKVHKKLSQKFVKSEEAYRSMNHLLLRIKDIAKYAIISYSNMGIVSIERMFDMFKRMNYSVLSEIKHRHFGSNPMQDLAHRNPIEYTILLKL